MKRHLSSIGQALAILLVAFIVGSLAGCTVAKSTQDQPVTSAVTQAGQPNVVQIQFFTVGSENARPVHAKAAGDTLGGIPERMADKWADQVNFAGATINLTVSVSSTGAATDSGVAQKSSPVVTQEPRTDPQASAAVALAPNSRANATVSRENTDSETTSSSDGDNPQPEPEPVEDADPDPAAEGDGGN